MMSLLAGDDRRSAGPTGKDSVEGEQPDRPSSQPVSLVPASKVFMRDGGGNFAPKATAVPLLPAPVSLPKVRA